jgi:exodeoxyribonuclease VII small subunit
VSKAAGTDAGKDAAGAQDLPRTYEEARAELEDVVRRLETGGVALEESLALWERGEQLARQCQDWLDGARRRLDAVREPAAGATATDSSSEEP